MDSIVSGALLCIWTKGIGSRARHGQAGVGETRGFPHEVEPYACWIARLVSTRARCFLSSGEARRSPLGFTPSAAASAALTGVAPCASALSTLVQRTGVGPTLVR